MKLRNQNLEHSTSFSWMEAKGTITLIERRYQLAEKVQSVFIADKSFIPSSAVVNHNFFIFYIWVFLCNLATTLQNETENEQPKRQRYSFSFMGLDIVKRILRASVHILVSLMLQLATVGPNSREETAFLAHLL
ncbi:coatomer [Striga asiatica]|uniref:Coatomer n=1 Tax=Striga asiatica TaxID=4170 RepID=A0A5A7PK99_STRAF|nr:coatomer [Striga asiatica]